MSTLRGSLGLVSQGQGWVQSLRLGADGMSGDKGYASARVLRMEAEHSCAQDSLSVKLELRITADQIWEFKRMFGMGFLTL